MKKRYTNGPQPGKDRNHIRSIATLSSLLMLLLLGLASCNVVPQGEAAISPNMVFPASSRGLTDYVGDVRLSITGAGIDQEWSLSQDVVEIAITLPAADNVRFELEATLGSLLNTGPVLSLGGVLWADLVAGETTVLDFYMSPYETKILVPDYFNNLLVQVEDLSITEDTPGSPEWNEFDLSLSDIVPWDVEIDNFGQIWIAHDYGIVAVNQIPPTETIPGFPDVFNYSPGGTFYSLAFDRHNNYLYYISDPDGIYINRIITDFNIVDLPDYSGENLNINATDLGVIGIIPFGLAVDNNGYLYIMANVGAGAPDNNLYKVDPEAITIVGQTDLSFPMSFGTGAVYDYPDILFKNGFIYVTNQYGADGEKILKFNTDLELVDSFGSAYTDGTTAGQFYGPSRFLATTNKKIYVTDEFASGSPQDGNRIVGFSDTDGSGWDTYQPVNDIEEDLFRFFQAPIN